MLATRSRHRRLLVSGLAAAVVIAVPFAAGAGEQRRPGRAPMPASPPSGRRRPTPATSTAAWPTTTPTRSTSAPTPKRVDSAGQPAGADACVPDFSSLVEDDGTLIGESGRASSNTFDFADPDATVSTDLFAFADSTSIAAFVFVVDEAHQDGLGTIVDVFASPDTATCLTQALQAQDTTSDTTFSPGDFAIANEATSASATRARRMTSTIRFEFDGVSTDYHSRSPSRASTGHWR